MVTSYWLIGGLVVAFLALGIRRFEARERRTIMKVTGLFASLVEHDWFDPMTIYPLVLLPFPKKEIVRRFCQRIAAEREAVKRNAYGVTLVAVARFQPGIDEPLSDSRLSILQSWKDADEDEKRTLVHKLAETSVNGTSVYHRLNKAVGREEILLMEMIEKAGSGSSDWVRLLDKNFSGRATDRTPA